MQELDRQALQNIHGSGSAEIYELLRPVLKRAVKVLLPLVEDLIREECDLLIQEIHNETTSFSE